MSLQRQTQQMDGTPPFLVIMRHSARLDLTSEGQIKMSEAQWTDREERPWDPPISDFNLPSNMAEAELADLSDKLAIYSSPFRRCLQTAAVVASKLKKKCIRVHPGLGEIMAKVRAEGGGVRHRCRRGRKSCQRVLSTFSGRMGECLKGDE